jgi:hypothetical protein
MEPEMRPLCSDVALSIPKEEDVEALLEGEALVIATLQHKLLARDASFPVGRTPSPTAARSRKATKEAKSSATMEEKFLVHFPSRSDSKWTTRVMRYSVGSGLLDICGDGEEGRESALGRGRSASGHSRQCEVLYASYVRYVDYKQDRLGLQEETTRVGDHNGRWEPLPPSHTSYFSVSATKDNFLQLFTSIGVLYARAATPPAKVQIEEDWLRALIKVHPIRDCLFLSSSLSLSLSLCVFHEFVSDT